MPLQNAGSNMDTLNNQEVFSDLEDAQVINDKSKQGKLRPNLFTNEPQQRNIRS